MKRLLQYTCFIISLLTSVCISSAEQIDARAVYEQWCAQCHGITGRGNGVNVTADMVVKPADHTDSLFMSTHSDEQLYEVISGGGIAVAKSPLMPIWSNTLGESEIRALVKYLRELCRCEYSGIASQKKLLRVDPEFR